MKNNLRQINVILYRLERNLGRPITLHRKTSTVQDYGTMTKTVKWESVPIKRAVIMTSKEMVSMLPKANTDFDYGGIFNVTDRFVLIRGTHSKTITPDDVIEFDSTRYQVSQVGSAYENFGHLIKVTAIKGNPVIGES